MTTDTNLNESVRHNIIIESRKKMTLTGITRVNSFDECTVSLETSMGSLTVKGSELKVDRLNVDTGELNIRGNILGLVYSEGNEKGGFLSRVFR